MRFDSCSLGEACQSSAGNNAELQLFLLQKEIGSLHRVAFIVVEELDHGPFEVIDQAGGNPNHGYDDRGSHYIEAGSLRRTLAEVVVRSRVAPGNPHHSFNGWTARPRHLRFQLREYGGAVGSGDTAGNRHVNPAGAHLAVCADHDVRRPERGLVEEIFWRSAAHG